MENLSNPRASWPSWAEFLCRNGLEDLAVWALEAAGPMRMLGAQAVYFGGPFLRPILSGIQLDALAHLLEDNDEARAFAVYLRKEEQA
jgi:hypothetical protein